MPFTTLSSFISFLEKKGDLHRIKAEVDPHLEITEITLRVFKKDGPALLFENVKGSSFPLVINILGSARRVKWALGRDPKDVGRELGYLAAKAMPPSLSNLWSMRGSLKNVLAMKPSRVSNPAVNANTIAPADLEQLPIAQSWPDDGGRFITFPLVITKSPEDGKQNMGVYRMQMFSKESTGMHWQIGKGGGYHYQQAEKKNEPLPLTVALGCDPILMMCGILPLPEGLDEMTFAGFLRNKATPVGTQENTQVRYPAEAEFILEGHVPPHERKEEGPYGDHFGHYSNKAPFPVFHVKRIRHRKNPVFPIAVVGKPPQEDQVIGDAVQEMLLPLLKVMHPEIEDLWAYMEAGFHNLLVISVKQRFKKESMKTALWALGEGQLALSKVVVLVDPDVNARSFNEVLKAIRKNFNPKSDFLLIPGTSQDTLDFTGPKMNLGSKMVLDATTGDSPSSAPVSIDLEAVKKVDSRIKDAQFFEGTMLIFQVSSGGREVLEKMLKSGHASQAKLVVAVSPDVPLTDQVLMLWGFFTRFDCQRDTFFGRVDVSTGHPVYEGPLFIDASWKEGYPKPLEMNADIVERVTKRWKEYGFK